VRRSSVSLCALLCLTVPSTAAARVVLDRPHDRGVLGAVATAPHHVIARVRPGQVIALRTRPFGRVAARVGAVTPFGSRRVLSVVASRRGRWLAVRVPSVTGNRIVWVDATAGGLRYSRTRLMVEVDLSGRTLTVRRGATVLRRTTVGVGAPGSPTPTGRFAVTDKLEGRDFGASYGCCILALSGVQPNLPAGWRGGNRLAIHGTLAGDFGQALSAGCVHARAADLRYLMRVLPLGTPVVIRP
jgi:L,D-transpeptidase catalytic domain